MAVDLAKRPGGSSRTAFCGMVTITTSRALAACSTVDAAAPVSAASAESDSGPRALAIRPWCPSLAAYRGERFGPAGVGHPNVVPEPRDAACEDAADLTRADDPDVHAISLL